MERKFAKDLIHFIDESVTAFHAVEQVKSLLDDNGFERIDLKDEWKLKKTGKYYTTKNNSALIAFIIGEEDLTQNGFRLIGAHTDSPTFRIKPEAEIDILNNYLKINTEVYGGPILNTWFDRPLSIAGRVMVKGENPFNPEEHLIDFTKPILTIPNLAIHMNREVNKGVEINPQEHSLPILSMIEEEFESENYLLKIISKELDIQIEEILDFDLFLYGTEKGELVGLNEEFISVGKLDDLAMIHAGIHGLIDSEGRNSTNVVVLFDHEEVGSSTKQAAGSPLLKNILKRISTNLELTEEEYFRALENSFMISADMAHAVHPNYVEKSDPNNRPIINKGPTIKIAANQAYTTDSYSSSVYEEICRNVNVPVQKFTNRSDARGGSTIGPISSSQINIASIDIGNPILAMHSIRELGGVKDHFNIYKSFVEYFNI